ncbi:MAG: hypothetical protein ACI9N0_000345 [Ilumatobacter sp.]|jgi:hypothetical protein
MATYDDDAVTLDERGVTVKNYYLPGRPRTIRYDDIDHAEIIQLGFGTGRHQLVGIGPLRPRLFFHWDRKRSTKSHGLSLDLGRRIQLAITPDDPDRVLAHIHSRTLTLDVDR